MVWGKTHFNDKVRDKRRSLKLIEMVILPAKHRKQQFQVFQGLHQHTGVGVKETQSEPLQDEVQAADGSIPLFLQVLQENRWDTEFCIFLHHFTNFHAKNVLEINLPITNYSGKTDPSYNIPDCASWW